MSATKYTPLPYMFDLLYDFKTVEDLHAHLTGKTRFATSGTDQALAKLMVEHDIPLPEGYITPAVADLSLEESRARYQELLETVHGLHLHAKRYHADDLAPMDRTWVLEQTGKALAKQPGLTDEQRQGYEKPYPFLSPPRAPAS